MTKSIGLLLLFGCACSTYMQPNVRKPNTISVEYKKTPNFFMGPSSETISYSQEINYWVDGKYTGHGKFKYWIPGHWERRIVTPPSDQGYTWVSGHYTRKPSKSGNPRGWVPGHWKKE